MIQVVISRAANAGKINVDDIMDKAKNTLESGVAGSKGNKWYKRIMIFLIFVIVVLTFTVWYIEHIDDQFSIWDTINIRDTIDNLFSGEEDEEKEDGDP